MIDPTEKLEVLERTDLVGLISEYVALKKSGRDYKGLCPFHQEKTPSFNVQAERRIWHCFGCGEGGDAIRFLMKIENMSYPEAMENLAKRCGVTLKKRSATPQEIRARSERERLVKLMRRTAAYYHQLLIGDPRAGEAREYLKKKRELSDETIAKYQLGYSADSWEDLGRTLRDWGVDPKDAEAVGLIRRRERGEGFYDFFRGRIMIPIRNRQGEVIALGARAMGDASPKYLNSPESSIYNKRATLYGLDIARRRLGDGVPAVVVEGYFDAISMHVAGVENAVATCGTALGREHLQVLRRYTRNLVMLYDADEAGVNAALGKLDLMLEEGMRPSFVALPEGEDPDSLVRNEGPEGIARRLEGAVPLVRFALERIAPSGAAAETADRTAVMERAAPLLRRIADPLERGYYARWLAERLNVPEEAVLAGLERQSRRGRPFRKAGAEGGGEAEDDCVVEVQWRDGGRPNWRGEKVIEKRVKLRAAEIERTYSKLLSPEEHLLRLVLCRRRLAPLVRESGVVAEIENEPLARLIERVCRAPEETSAVELLGEIRDENLYKLVTRLSSMESPQADLDEGELLEELTGQIRRRAAERKLARIGREADGPGEDPLGDRELLRRHLETLRKAKNK